MFFVKLLKKLLDRFDTARKVKGSHRQLGQKGEKLAAKFFKKKCGMKILGRNYRTPYGEVDMLALDGRDVVFCEVKTRSDSLVDPQSAIDSRRKGRYRNAAKHYLAQKGRKDLAVRFDVVFVIMDKDNKPQLQHIKNAF